MEDGQWEDPLLLTDVSQQEEEQSCNYVSRQDRSFDTADMADPDDSHPNINNGRCMLGFSPTSPDLVICAGSPDMNCNKYEETPEYLKKRNGRNGLASIELSLEEGITGLETRENSESTRKRSVSFPELPNSNVDMVPEASLELFMKSTTQNKCPRTYLPVLSINAGGDAVTSDGVDFLEDMLFTGGEVIRTDAIIEDGNECLALYQSARFGNFSYKVQNFDPGNYFVDLHLAEIIITDGPPGMRVFDVFIQEEKVVSGIDIYARVGSNKVLVLSDLEATVHGKEGLSIRFEGVIGSPIVCGVSIRKDCLAGEMKFFEEKESSQTGDHKELEDFNEFKCNINEEDGELRRKFELQYKELTETRKALEEIKRENDLKSKECREAWMSLHELQNELMRKSMHVGSLAFAIEGQVKEKSRCFSSLRDLTRKLKILKMEHITLSEEASEYKKCLRDMTQITNIIQSKMNQHVDMEKELNEVKLKFIEGAKERKELYNKVQELKGNIRVFCRCRPLNNEEIAGGAITTIDFESAKDGELTVKGGNGASKKIFKFDSIFTPQANQAEVFEETAPLATSVLDGYNVCIFAYGQTGSGKTFTMEGSEEARGVNYRTLEELFRIIKDRQGLYRYEISVSVLEVYNEQIRDLLLPGSQSGASVKRLEIRQVAEGIHHVPGLVESHVNNMHEVWEVLKTGSSARAVGSTNANEHSSRSHCIHCVMVKGENLINGECTRSKLWLVDLAGSERIAKTDVQGERLKETQNINRSLSALGDVISALATKSPHIPFRNSKLTHLLQDSLGGDSKTLMFVQISPKENDLSETLCSLNFASRVRGIELGPAKKQLDGTELVKYKQMVEKSKQDIKSKEVLIKKMEETVQGLDQKLKARDLNNKNLQDKVKELESQLLIERKLARQHVDAKIAEQQQQLQQLEEQQIACIKSPQATRLFANQKIASEPASSLGKDVINLVRPLTDNNSRPAMAPPPTDNFFRFSNLAEKENRPVMSEQPPLLQKRSGRASICTTTRRLPLVPAPRRNSLIPLPSTPSMVTLPSPLLPMPQPQADPIKEEDTEESEGSLPDQTPHILKGQKSGGTKKVSSILRRSLQKKIYIKSPMQQRRMGANGGMEKVRLSIGSRGRMGQRGLVSNATRAAKEVQQKQSQQEKERGWNVGSGGAKWGVGRGNTPSVI
ncbi:kinesin-like protein KIN-14Q isoform X2 [Macadamia integrifolia]|uniref:kinesin-like protein KIN-14Q isoform X2 n=1 Tax=Macadamia integrifolia TaxID=60698 RepID=UPI001C4E36ED|nr:kinesin-like protein KIN-14Q isoform X2 [Macadamia integrifolia]